MIPLFEYHPLLRDKLPHVSLGEFPTPIRKLERLGHDLGLGHLYMKRDDLSGRIYGGNKIRKFEFILGNVLRTNAKEVMTFSPAGSKHAMTITLSSQQLGLKAISMATPHQSTPDVCRNLLMTYYCGAELHQYRNKNSLIVGTVYQLLRHKLKYGSFPRVIFASRPSPLGAIGFVNAAYELKEQIMRGQMPEPDRIYVASGTTDTAVGLKIGLKAANIKSQVIPVGVRGEKPAIEKRFTRNFYKTISFLGSLDPSFPIFELSDKDAGIVDSFLETGCAGSAREVKEALTLMEKSEGIRLDTTYTGKAVAALIDDAKKQALRDEVILFWNTFNSRDFSGAISTVDYHNLPKCFHRYFEEEAQPRNSTST